MIKKSTALIAALFVSGCQMTQQPDILVVDEHTSADFVAAQPKDIVNALILGALNEEQIVEEPPVFDDVWERIRYQLSIPVPQNRAIVAERNYYAQHQSYLDRISKRGAPYLHYIVEEVEKRQMPIELALLPIVESAFDPFGFSNRAASGIWQFMPQTGERFNLKQNWWYDGRRDIVESTRAALDYLTYLHQTLDGDWLNAIAAYNSGEGRVMRAIQKNRKKNLPTDFWSLDLPTETTAYVPKLLALSDLLKRSDKFAVTWQPIINAQVVDVVDVGSQIDLALAAEMAQMSLTELYRLNPGYNRWATDPQGPHTLLLPLDIIAPFNEQLAKTNFKQRIRWQHYEVKKGDSLSVIAKKFDTSSQSIQTLNELDSNKIKVGQTLLVPLSDAHIDNEHLSTQMKLAAAPVKKTKVRYRVQQGDTLWDISNAHDVTIKQLANWNKLSSDAILKLNQELVIHKTNQAAQPSRLEQSAKAITYKVRKGDSLARIASKFKVSVDDIVKWNKIDSQQYLQPGQKLKLTVDVVTRT